MPRLPTAVGAFGSSPRAFAANARRKTVLIGASLGKRRPTPAAHAFVAVRGRLERRALVANARGAAIALALSGDFEKSPISAFRYKSASRTSGCQLSDHLLVFPHPLKLRACNRRGRCLFRIACYACKRMVRVCSVRFATAWQRMRIAPECLA